MESNRQHHQYNLRSSAHPNCLDFSAGAAGNTSVPPSLPSLSSTTSMTSAHFTSNPSVEPSSTMAQPALQPSSQIHPQYHQQQQQHHPWGQPQSQMPLMSSQLPHQPHHHQPHTGQGFMAAVVSAPPTAAAEHLPPQNEMDMDMDAPGGSAATAPFLRDFTLVAEAVKRVQMEVVMSEMESITL